MSEDAAIRDPVKIVNSNKGLYPGTATAKGRPRAVAAHWPSSPRAHGQLGGELGGLSGTLSRASARRGTAHAPPPGRRECVCEDWRLRMCVSVP
jgi:hypothetical protein